MLPLLILIVLRGNRDVLATVQSTPEYSKRRPQTTPGNVARIRVVLSSLHAASRAEGIKCPSRSGLQHCFP
jgi:hypothetical protein